MSRSSSKRADHARIQQLHEFEQTCQQLYSDLIKAVITGRRKESPVDNHCMNDGKATSCRACRLEKFDFPRSCPLCNTLEGSGLPQSAITLAWEASLAFHASKAWLLLRLSHPFRLEVPVLQDQPGAVVGCMDDPSAIRYGQVIGGQGNCDPTLLLSLAAHDRPDLDDLYNIQHENTFFSEEEQMFWKGMKVTLDKDPQISKLNFLYACQRGLPLPKGQANSFTLEKFFRGLTPPGEVIVPGFTSVCMTTPHRHFDDPPLRIHMAYPNLAMMRWMHAASWAIAIAMERKLFKLVKGSASGDTAQFHRIDEWFDLPVGMDAKGRKVKKTPGKAWPYKVRFVYPCIEQIEKLSFLQRNAVVGTQNLNTKKPWSDKEEVQMLSLVDAEKLLDAKSMKSRGNVAYKEGKYEEAYKRYHQALKMLPASVFVVAETNSGVWEDISNIRSNLAQSCWKLKRHKEVIKHSTDVVGNLSSMPDDTVGLIYMGRCIWARANALEQLHRFQDAEKDAQYLETWHAGRIRNPPSCVKRIVPYTEVKAMLSRLEQKMDREEAKMLWTKVETYSPSPPARQGHSATLDEKQDRILVFGGLCDEDELDKIRDKGCFSLGGWLFPTAALNDVWAFDLKKHTWTKLHTLPQQQMAPDSDNPGAESGSAVSEGKAKQNNQVKANKKKRKKKKKQAERTTGDEEQEETFCGFPSPRAHHTAVLHTETLSPSPAQDGDQEDDGTVHKKQWLYIVGGQDGDHGDVEDSFWRLDLDTLRWQWR